MADNIFFETSGAIINPLTVLWSKVVMTLPQLVAAAIVIIVGAFVGIILGHASRVILEKLKVDEVVRKAKLTKAVGHTHVPAIVGELLKWYIIIIFLQAAVSLLNLGTLSAVLETFIAWLPHVLVAVIVMLLGLAAAHFIQIKIEEHSKLKGVKTFSKLLKVIVIILVTIIALKEIGIDVSILENTFLLIVGGLAVGIALALGIGLGLGLKKEAEVLVKDVKKNF